MKEYIHFITFIYKKKIKIYIKFFKYKNFIFKKKKNINIFFFGFLNTWSVSCKL